MKIGTHSGVFQADDVLAVAMLRMLYPEAEVIRSRKDDVLETCDVVVDVGGVYDHARRRYDHHQTGRAGSRANGVLYSACGLIWKHYGAEICGSAEVAARVDRDFVQAVDAIDNGQELYSGGRANFDTCRTLSFSGVISSLNPGWQETGEIAPGITPEEAEEATAALFHRAFTRAVGVVTTFLLRAIDAASGVKRAEEITRGAIAAAGDPRIIELPRFCPWQETVVDEAPHALLVIFQNERGDWMAQCVPTTTGGFNKRLPLPQAWSGLRDLAFAEATGVPDAIFCHAGLFIMGARSREGILELVRLALQRQ